VLNLVAYMHDVACRFQSGRIIAMDDMHFDISWKVNIGSILKCSNANNHSDDLLQLKG
jgi:hypothetical protein